MKAIYYIIFGIAILSFSSYRKPIIPEEKVTITGTIYLNCNDLAANKTYYFRFPSNNMWYKTDPPIAFTTDANGTFVVNTTKKDSRTYQIFDKESGVGVNMGGFLVQNPDLTINYSVGPFSENITSKLVLKLKTNHPLPATETIRYSFRYSNVFNAVPGPISKDAIIKIQNVEMGGGFHNSNSIRSEQRTLWWNVNKPVVGTDDNQVDYTIHGCAAVADTAYIVAP